MEKGQEILLKKLFINENRIVAQYSFFRIIGILPLFSQNGFIQFLSKESLFSSHSLQLPSRHTFIMLIDVIQTLNQIAIFSSQNNILSSIMIFCLRLFIGTLTCQKIELKSHPSFSQKNV
jgi:hypothetical protein